MDIHFLNADTERKAKTKKSICMNLAIRKQNYGCSNFTAKEQVEQCCWVTREVFVTVGQR
jgi:hypothetical protein